MAAEIKKEIQLEIAHVLFIDIVGYSKLSINDQHAAVEELNRIVRASEQFQQAEAADRLIRIPTGDGMVLVFYTNPEAPAQCAVEISRALKEHPPFQACRRRSRRIREVATVSARSRHIRSETRRARLGREPLRRSIRQCEAAAEIRDRAEAQNASAVGGSGRCAARACRDYCCLRLASAEAGALCVGDCGKKYRGASI